MEEFLTSHNIILCMFGAVIVFWLRRIDRKFDSIDKKFDKIELEMKDEFISIRKDIQGLSDRISHIEGILWATHGYSAEDRRKEMQK